MITRVKYEVGEKSIHARVFMGPEMAHVVMCGNLMFSHEEFKIFRSLLEDGSLLVKGTEVIFSDSTGGSSSSFPKVQLPEG